jgi:hypothetical protein
LPELSVEPPVNPEVADSTKLCNFLADMALKKQAALPPLLAFFEEIPDATLVPSTVAIEGIGGHKLIHGYSAEYPFSLANENHVVFNPH